MPFNSPAFAVFFLLFFLAYHLLVRNQRSKLLMLIGGSLLFYATFSWQFIPLLLGLGFANYLCVRAIGRRTDRRGGRYWLWAGVALNLGALIWFKYTRFFVAVVVASAHLAGSQLQAKLPELVLPIGLSFFTLQGMSYVIDAYRGALRPRGGFLEFFASLTFFPHLLAGPICRGPFLLPQFDAPGPVRWDSVRQGFALLGLGLLKKTLADLLAIVVDQHFTANQPLGALEAWTSALAFAGQMYGDFSGYTDMASGAALLLGFRLPVNFDLPYLAASPADFWRRWHISLSTWFRDYVFVPLSLKRRRPYQNIVITMVLAGLWHGAGWAFVVFGLYHGILLAVTQGLKSKFGGPPPDEGRGRRLARMLVTFYFVVIGMVIFRAGNFRAFARMLRAMHVPEVSSRITSGGLLSLGVVVIALVMGHALEAYVVRGRIHERHPRMAWALAVVALALAMMAGDRHREFIYVAF